MEGWELEGVGWAGWVGGAQIGGRMERRVKEKKLLDGVAIWD